jgi:hypothetical protein
VSALLAEAAPPEVDGPMIAITFGSEISFWETMIASPPPFSMGVSAWTSVTLSPYFFDRFLTPYFAHVTCSWPMKPPPPVSGVTIPSLIGLLQLTTACEPDTADEPAPAVAASAAAPSAASASATSPRPFMPCSSLVGIPR